jgi:hypothetical protein
MDDLFTSSDMTHLPQSVVSIKSKNGLNASSSNGSTPVIDFEIGGSLGFYLAEDVVMSFDFTYVPSVDDDGNSVVYNLRPQNAGGMGNMIRQIDIYSIQDGVLLESISDYHILNSVLMSHNNGSDLEVQDGNFKKWSITECYTNDYQERTPFVTPNSYPTTPVALVADQAYQTQKIQLPLRLSHLLSSSQVIPVSALGGLRVRLQLNRPEIFNMFSGWEVDQSVLINAVTPDGDTPTFTILEGVDDTITFGGDDYVVPAGTYTIDDLVTAVNQVVSASGTITCDDYALVGITYELVFANSDTDAITLSGTFMTEFCVTGEISVPADGTHNANIRANKVNLSTNLIYLTQKGLHLNNPLDLSTCPFKVGQSVMVNGDATITGVVSDISVTTLDDDDYVTLTLVDGITLPAITDATYIQSFVPSTTSIEYSLKNISLLVPIITPPPSYVAQLATAIASSEGMSMDMKTFGLVRSNIMKGQTLASLQLPFVNTRAKGLIAIPHLVSTGSFLSRYACDNLSMLNMSKYFFEYMGTKHPEQGLNTEKARVGSLSQELIVEQVKAFEYTLGKLGSLAGYDDKYKSKTFFIGRNLGIFNSVMDTRTANIFLTIEATSGAGGVLNSYTPSSLSVHTYCASISTIVMRPAGVMLVK